MLPFKEFFPFGERKNLAWACDPLLPGKWSTLKTLDLNKLLTWTDDMVMQYWSANTLFWKLSIYYNMDVQYQRCPYWCYSLVGLHSCSVIGRTSTWKTFFLAKWVTRFSKVWASARVPSALRELKIWCSSSDASLLLDMQHLLLLEIVFTTAAPAFDILFIGCLLNTKIAYTTAEKTMMGNSKSS